MPPTIFLRVDHYDRQRDTHLPVVEATIEEALDQQDRLEVAVPREDFYEHRDRINFLHDAFYLSVGDEKEDAFGGRLVEMGRGGSSVVLDIRSFEEDARTAEPTEGTLVYDNARDADIVIDALEMVDTVRPGTIQAIDRTADFMFSHASPAAMIRRVAETAGAEVKYRADATVDYVRRLGHDRTIELSPTNQTVTTEFSTAEKSREQYNHLLALGSGEGDHQFSIRLRGEDYGLDPGDERPVWKKVAFKDVTSEDRLQLLAEQYFAEYRDAPVHIEVEMDIDGVGVELGDTFPVSFPREEIHDERLRVIELETNIDEAGVTYQARLSNRRLTVADPGKDVREDIENYRTAFEGDAVPMSESGGRQPVDPDNNYEMSVFYPSDVAKELDSTLHIRGLAYRSYSRGAASGGGTFSSVSSASNDDFENVVETEFESANRTVGQTWDTISTINPESNTSMMFSDISVFQAPTLSYTEHPDFDANDRVGVPRPYRARLYNASTGEYFPNTSGIVLYMYPDSTNGYRFVDASDVEGEHLELQMRYAGSLNAFPLLWVYTRWIGIGQHIHDVEVEVPDHEHDPDPGIIEYDRYPSNCNVVINGQSVDVSLGDGSREFAEEVDISGFLTEGFNDIEVTSDSLGMLNVTASRDLYRQILGRSS